MDDISRHHIFPGDQASAHIVNKLATASQLITQSMQPAGYGMNEDKDNAILSMRGRGSAARTWLVQHATRGKAKKRARVLGPQLGYDGKVSVEVSERIKAAKAAWSRSGTIWTKRLSRKIKRCLFTALVQGAALSGLEALILTEKQELAIDKCLVKMLRSLMGGAQKGKGDDIRIYTNKEVLRYWRLAPTKVELQVRRIKWYQKIAADPKGARATLACWLGQNKLDNLLGIKRLDDTGWCCSASTPWAWRMQEDLKVAGEEEELQQWYQDLEGLPSAFKGDNAKTLIAFDAKIMRARAFSAAVPPPGYRSEDSSSTSSGAPPWAHVFASCWTSRPARTLARPVESSSAPIKSCERIRPPAIIHRH